MYHFHPVKDLGWSEGGRRVFGDGTIPLARSLTNNVPSKNRKEIKGGSSCT